MTSGDTKRFLCEATEDSNHRWMAFIKGNRYIVHEIKYSNGTIDKTHNGVSGIFRMKDGTTDSRYTPFSKADCKQYLKLVKDDQRQDG